MNGVWVAWLDGEGWGGCDTVFETEHDARQYVVNQRVGHQVQYPKLPYRDRFNVAFVPWGEHALEQDSA